MEARRRPLLGSNNAYTTYLTGGIRQKALRAADAVLARDGIKALSLRAIAEQARIGIASIYHYFSNKEALLLSLAVNGFDRLRAELDSADATLPSELPLKQVSTTFFAFAEDSPALFALMYDTQLLATHPELRAAEARALETFERYIAADPRFPTQRSPEVSVALWALGRGIAAVASSQPGGRMTPEQTDAFTAGIGYILFRI